VKGLKILFKVTGKDAIRQISNIWP